MCKHNKFPKNVMIQTTNYCNGHCIFCPYEEVSQELPQGHMEEAIFKKIVDECRNYENIQRIMPYLMNEPLMDKDIVRKINYIKDKNPEACVHILTNGSLLTPQLLQKLINSELDWIGISIHGIYPLTIEKTMGLEPEITLNRVCDFIERVKESNRNLEDFVMITFLKHRNLSFAEKNQVFEFWKAKGVKRISYFDGPVSRAGNVKSLPKVKNESINGCNSIWTKEMFHILYNGDVILCCMDWRREVILGNVRKESIFEIWNSDRYSYIREIINGKRELPDNFLCSRCESAVTKRD